MLLMILLLLSTSPLAFVHDCYLPVENNTREFLQCHSGQVLSTIEEQSYLFQPKTVSERQLFITSFLVSNHPVTAYEYARYLRLSRIDPEVELKNHLGQHSPEESLKGLTLKEAMAYCRFFGQDLPTEAEQELMYLGGKHLKHRVLSEWSKDYYRDPVPQYYQGTNPRQNAVSHRQVVRNLSHLYREGLNPSLRYDKVGFRCVSRLPNPSVSEILLLPSQYAMPVESSPPILRLDSIPSNAMVYLDAQMKFPLGKTPLIRKLPEGEYHLLFTMPDHHSKTLRVNLKNGFGYNPVISLSPTGPDFKISINRNTTEIRIAEGFVKPDGYYQRKSFVPAFYVDQIPVTNLMYREYAIKTSNPLPRCGRHEELTHPDQFVNCISWDEALSYCNFYGMTLPTNLQMQKIILEHNPKDLNIKGLTQGREWLLDWEDEDSDKNRRVLTREERPVYNRKKLTFPQGSEEPLKNRLDLGFRCVRSDASGLREPQKFVDAPLQSDYWLRP